MKKVPIYSASDPADPRPWAVLNVTDGSPTVELVELNGLIPFRKDKGDTQQLGLTEAQEQAVQANLARSKAKHTFALSRGARRDDEPPNPERPTLADEVHVIGITLDGQVELVPVSRQQTEYYAHLGEYDPLTGEWTVLEFAEAPSGQ